MKEIKQLEDNMPIAVLTSKGQMTIPKEVRKALDLKSSGKVVIVVDGDQAILKPLNQLWDVVDKLKYYHLSNFVLKIRNLLKLVNNAPHFSYSEKDV
ncbi:MAG: AbrB/MazE/SpoVT family DNA-binding domain-containing protein [Deltaproteobacteria bacterium]|nr:AbrB/MazE/SpoVT family DNA-binding domain-containing protein [Deltaproteobacteria bacterium]